MLISANLGFDYVLASQAQKHVTMNEALQAGCPRAGDCTR